MTKIHRVTKQPPEIWQQIKQEMGVTKEQVFQEKVRKKRLEALRRWAEIAYESNYSVSGIGRQLTRDHSTVLFYLRRTKKSRVV